VGARPGVTKRGCFNTGKMVKVTLCFMNESVLQTASLLIAQLAGGVMVHSVVSKTN
jgi:hypothetical protein